MIRSPGAAVRGRLTLSATDTRRLRAVSPDSYAVGQPWVEEKRTETRGRQCGLREPAGQLAASGCSGADDGIVPGASVIISVVASGAARSAVLTAGARR
ncbi:MAG: hypothetical protein M3256_09910 [Actinomycetota bacterium]|nr:hypothetical protein [Actinomycetota bacterium]